MLEGSQDYVSGDLVQLAEQENFIGLHGLDENDSVDASLHPHLVQQRSKPWFRLRENVLVTGMLYAVLTHLCNGHVYTHDGHLHNGHMYNWAFVQPDSSTLFDCTNGNKFPFSFHNNSLGLAGGLYYQKIALLGSFPYSVCHPAISVIYPYFGLFLRCMSLFHYTGLFE